MSFQEYVNQLFESHVDLYDLSDEDLIMLEEEYKLNRENPALRNYMDYATNQPMRDGEEIRNFLNN